MSSRRRRAFKDDDSEDGSDLSSVDSGNDNNDIEEIKQEEPSVVRNESQQVEQKRGQNVKKEKRNSSQERPEKKAEVARKNPAFVPRGGQFFLHDNRQHSKNDNMDHGHGDEKSSRKKSTHPEVEESSWKHDRFEQASDKPDDADKKPTYKKNRRNKGRDANPSGPPAIDNKVPAEAVHAAHPDRPEGKVKRRDRRGRNREEVDATPTVSIADANTNNVTALQRKLQVAPQPQQSDGLAAVNKSSETKTQRLHDRRPERAVNVVTTIPATTDMKREANKANNIPLVDAKLKATAPEFSPTSTVRPVSHGPVSSSKEFPAFTSSGTSKISHRSYMNETAYSPSRAAYIAHQEYQPYPPIMGSVDDSIPMYNPYNSANGTEYMHATYAQEGIEPGTGYPMGEFEGMIYNYDGSEGYYPESYDPYGAPDVDVNGNVICMGSGQDGTVWYPPVAPSGDPSMIQAAANGVTMYHGTHHFPTSPSPMYYNPAINMGGGGRRKNNFRGRYIQRG